MPHTSLPFETKPLPAEVDVLAPDTCEIRVLLAGQQGSMAHGTLQSGAVSIPVRHRTVEEIWYVLHGDAEMWRKQGGREEVVQLRAGFCVTIPLGTAFQVRTTGEEPFRFVMVTMPPWPGEQECDIVEGRWPVGQFS